MKYNLFYIILKDLIPIKEYFRNYVYIELSKSSDEAQTVTYNCHIKLLLDFGSCKSLRACV